MRYEAGIRERAANVFENRKAMYKRGVAACALIWAGHAALSFSEVALRGDASTDSFHVRSARECEDPHA